MKMVAASKFRRAQLAVESSRPYFKILENNISKIVNSLNDDYSHPFTTTRKEIKKIAIIVISSDQGMCGAFNTNLLKETTTFINDNLSVNYPNAEVSVLPIGRKAVSFFNKQNYPVIAKYTQITTSPNFETVKSIIDPLKDSFIHSDYDLVFVSYVKFMHIMKQVPTVMQLLPFVPTAKQTQTKQTNINDVYIFEPDQNSILDALIPKMIDSKVWAAILESVASEHAARRVAMDNATSNAGDLIKSLNLEYNKLRQASITSEIIEIVSGAEALRG
jgi:F-type H+-transporting ATPase subunit gamma